MLLCSPYMFKLGNQPQFTSLSGARNGKLNQASHSYFWGHTGLNVQIALYIWCMLILQGIFLKSRERDIRNICAGWKSKPVTVDRKDSFAVTRVSAAYNTTVKLSLKSVGVM